VLGGARIGVQYHGLAMYKEEGRGSSLAMVWKEMKEGGRGVDDECGELS
jgi:hypothetical protein